MQFEKARDFILNKLAKELPEHLYYHSSVHTHDVYAAARLLAMIEQIDTYSTQLILTAACYHDAGFLSCTTGHEEVSCSMALEDLPAFNYTPVEIEQIRGMIRATRIPQSPQTHSEQILADADLDYLGQDDYFAISHKLYLELLHLGTVSDEAEWDIVQLNFMESHRYFTKTAIKLREDKKQFNLEKIKARIHKTAF